MDCLKESYSKLIDGKIISGCSVKFVVTVVAIAIGLKAAKKAYSWRAKKLRKENSLKNKDLVILHQFPRAVHLPNLSPFPIKLETYLKLANIPYKNDYKDPMGPKGKCPFITLNGEDITDSQLIIEHLNKVFKVDLNKNLSPEDKAIGRAMRVMLEDHLYWVIVLYRWVWDKEKKIMTMSNWPWYVSPFLYSFVSRNCKKAAYMQGMGRHTKQEVLQMGIKDLQAISNFIGTKKFMFGDDPAEDDCAIFGILLQMLYTFPGTPFEDIMNGECQNLKDYCLRMKERIWPDWEKHIWPRTR